MSNKYDDVGMKHPPHAPIDMDIGPMGCGVAKLPNVFDGIPMLPGPPTLTSGPLTLTLAQRGSRYGDFTNNAQVAQQMREIVRAACSWEKMTPVEREALDAILLKISRIVTGDPHYPDNWHDIQGFAKLVEDRLPAFPGVVPATP